MWSLQDYMAEPKNHSADINLKTCDHQTWDRNMSIRNTYLWNLELGFGSGFSDVEKHVVFLFILRRFNEILSEQIRPKSVPRYQHETTLSWKKRFDVQTHVCEQDHLHTQTHTDTHRHTQTHTHTQRDVHIFTRFPFPDESWWICWVEETHMTNLVSTTEKYPLNVHHTELSGSIWVFSHCFNLSHTQISETTNITRSPTIWNKFMGSELFVPFLCYGRQHELKWAAQFHLRIFRRLQLHRRLVLTLLHVIIRFCFRSIWLPIFSSSCHICYDKHPLQIKCQHGGTSKSGTFWKTRQH